MHGWQRSLDAAAKLALTIYAVLCSDHTYKDPHLNLERLFVDRKRPALSNSQDEALAAPVGSNGHRLRGLKGVSAGNQVGSDGLTGSSGRISAASARLWPRKAHPRRWLPQGPVAGWWQTALGRRERGCPGIARGRTLPRHGLEQRRPAAEAEPLREEA